MQPFYVICPDIRSLHNVGAIFRTADGLGVTKLFLCGYTPQPPRKEIHKVALGAEDSIPWEYHKQAWRVLDRLKQEGVSIVALELTSDSVSLHDFKPSFPLALIVGNEVEGLSDSLIKRADHVCHLPMHGIKASLNVAVAFGAAGYLLSGYRR
jgi:tRNA G18 (ribose-2'-O)-methylase SpoU